MCMLLTVRSGTGRRLPNIAQIVKAINDSQGVVVNLIPVNTHEGEVNMDTYIYYI